MRWLRVAVARVNDRLGRHRRQLLQAVVHLLGVAAGQVRAAAAIEEQGVAADQTSVDMEALATGRVARSVHQPDRNRSDLDHVTGVVRGEMIVPDTRRPLYPRNLLALHVDRAVGP